MGCYVVSIYVISLEYKALNLKFFKVFSYYSVHFFAFFA